MTQETQPHISINQQIEGQRVALTRQSALANGSTVKPGMTKSEEAHQLVRLQGVMRSLKWFQDHELEIKGFMRLEPGDRAAILANGPLAAQLVRQAKAEAPAIAD